MNLDSAYMCRCLQLANQGVGDVAPNPMVGTVIVYNNRIIGEGFHHRYGEAHAEPNAIASVLDKALLSKSTLYVNLEPCSHYGKTPPCADLIVRKGIKRVVVGTLDPNPKVAGRGVEILRQAGIDITVGVLENECRELNKRFFIAQEQKRPYVLLKWAQTGNGFIDNKRNSNNQNPLLISNAFTRALTHKMRAENQAIMVGTNTVLLDNPALTVRYWSGKSPIRVVIDQLGKIPSYYQILDQSVHTIVFTEKTIMNLSKTEFITIQFDENILKEILQILYKKNIHSVLIEGGSMLLQNFIDKNLWDEANVEIAPELVISDGVKAPLLLKTPSKYETIEGHQWISYVNEKT